MAEYALRFNGTTSVVTVTDADSIDLIGNYSICFWFNANSIGEGNGGRVLDKSGTGGYVVGFTATNTLFVNNGASSKTFASSAYTFGVPHLCVITYDGSNLRLYIDGALFDTVAQTTNPSANSNTLYIGNRSGNDRTADADLDDIRIYKGRVLDGTEIANLFAGIDPTTTNLSAHWKFDEGSGTSATDSSGNSATGTISNATYVSPLPVSPSASASSSSSASLSPSASISPSTSISPSLSPSSSISPSISPSASISPSSSLSPSSSVSLSVSVSASPSESLSVSPSASVSPSPSNRRTRIIVGSTSFLKEVELYKLKQRRDIISKYKVTRTQVFKKGK